MKNDKVNILVDTNYNIKYIESLPERLAHSCIYEYDAMYCQSCYEYEQALHQAKANAIPVANEEYIKVCLWESDIRNPVSYGQWLEKFLKTDTIYPLEGYEVEITDRHSCKFCNIDKSYHRICFNAVCSGTTEEVAYIKPIQNIPNVQELFEELSSNLGVPSKYFGKLEEKETQEELWKDLFRYIAIHGDLAKPEDHFTITRK